MLHLLKKSVMENFFLFSVQIREFFKKTKFTLLISIYFHFKTPTKQMLVFFRARLSKRLIWQKSTQT